MLIASNNILQKESTGIVCTSKTLGAPNEKNLHEPAVPRTLRAFATVLCLSYAPSLPYYHIILLFNAHTLAIKNCLSLGIHPTYSIDNILETTLVVPTAMN